MKAASPEFPAGILDLPVRSAPSTWSESAVEKRERRGIEGSRTDVVKIMMSDSHNIRFEIEQPPAANSLPEPQSQLCSSRLGNSQSCQAHPSRVVSWLGQSHDLYALHATNRVRKGVASNVERLSAGESISSSVRSFSTSIIFRSTSRRSRYSCCLAERGDVLRFGARCGRCTFCIYILSPHAEQWTRTPSTIDVGLLSQ